MVGVLFVCLGNICRSPTAEGVFRHIVAREGLADRIAIDSAGTHDYHIDEPPDSRAQAAAAKRGFDLSALRGRQVAREDFTRFKYVLGMDRSNLSHLTRMKPKDSAAHVGLFLDFAAGLGIAEVPDPYYGGGAGFELVLDMTEAAARGLLEHIRRSDLKP